MELAHTSIDDHIADCLRKAMTGKLLELNIIDGDSRSDPPRSYKVYQRSWRRNTDQAALWLDDSYPGFDREEMAHPPLVHHREGIRRLDFAESRF